VPVDLPHLRQLEREAFDVVESGHSSTSTGR
jgi:hypothetical protein